MSTVDIGSVVDQKSHDLSARPEGYKWAVCAAIWARTFILAAPGWKRWPEIFDIAREAFSRAILRCIEDDVAPPLEPLIAKLKNISLEDDGSAEWEYVIDLIEMVQAALQGEDANACLQTAMRSYLQGTEIVMVNSYADSSGGTIRNNVAMERLAADPEWAKALDFIKAL